MSKSYDVLSDRQIEIILDVLGRELNDKYNSSNYKKEINEIIAYFKMYDSALNPLDHEQSK